MTLGMSTVWVAAWEGLNEGFGNNNFITVLQLVALQ